MVAALLLALFVWRQRQLTRAASVPGNTKPPPLIPHGLLSWKNRDILVICVASFFNWAATEVGRSSGREVTELNAEHLCLHLIPLLRRARNERV